MKNSRAGQSKSGVSFQVLSMWQVIHFIGNMKLIWHNLNFSQVLEPHGPLLLTKMFVQWTTPTNSKTKATSSRSTILFLIRFMCLLCTLQIWKDNIIHSCAEGFYLRMDIFLDLLLLIGKWCFTSHVNDLLSICFISILSQKLVAENRRFL